MNYTLLQQLIEDCAAYEKVHGQERTMPHFARWLAGKYSQSVPAPAAPDPVSPSGADMAVVIGSIVFFLTRYAKVYAKKAMEGSPLNSIDEFVYLTALLNRPDGIGKTELIRYNRHEKPTGMEIIRRLITLGLVQQNPSTQDKRKMVLTMTQDGVQIIFPLLKKMSVVSKTLVGNLSLEEQIHLSGLLEKLDHFHLELLGTLKGDWTLDDLTTPYMQQP